MICDYGCGSKSQYVLKNGKDCCSLSFQKCPAIRRKNADGLKMAYKEGRKDCSHFDGKREWSKGKNALTDSRIGKTFEKIFCEDSDSSTEYLKKLIIDNDLKPYECVSCGLNDIWNDKPLGLELDHINGKRSDNRLENIRYLCPNCHSQTPTFKGRNKKHTQPVSDKDLITAMRQSKNIRQSLIKVGMDPKGANYNRVHYLKGKYDITFKD